MSETQEQYAKFKEEYPAVYARLLEINRALAKLQRQVAATARENVAMPAASGENTASQFLEID